MNYINLFQILGGAGVGIAILALIAGKSKKSIKVAKWTLVIGAAFLLTLIPAVGTFLTSNVTGLGNTLAVGDTSDTTSNEIPADTSGGTLCAVEDTTVTLASQDKYTSLASGGTHRYKINNGIAKTVSDAGTFTASPGDQLEVLYGNETSLTYFGVLNTYTIPCKGTYEPNSVKTILNSSAATLNIYNEEGDLIVNQSSNETLAAGDVVDLKIELKASNQRGYPNGAIFVMELNGSDYDEGETDLSFNDLTVESASVPNAYSIVSTENKVKAWKVSSWEGTTTHIGSVTLDVDNTNNPAPSNNSVPFITIIPLDYYVDEDNGGAFTGPAVEDEDGAYTWGPDSVHYIYVD